MVVGGGWGGSGAECKALGTNNLIPRTALYCTVLYCTVLYCTVLYQVLGAKHTECPKFDITKFDTQQAT